MEFVWPFRRHVAAGFPFPCHGASMMGTESKHQINRGPRHSRATKKVDEAGCKKGPAESAQTNQCNWHLSAV